MAIIFAQLAGFKLNSELAAWLRATPYLESGWVKPDQIVVYRALSKKLHDRLTDEKIDELVTAFKTGVAKHVLAERYGISVSSVKRLLRERGAKRRSRWDKAA